MNIHSWLAEKSSLLWPFVANHLWQSTVFLVVVFLTGIALRSGPARTQYSVLLLGAIKLAIPSAAIFLLATSVGIDLRSFFASRNGGESTPIVSQITEPVAQLSSFEAPKDAPEKHSEVLCVLSIVWAIGFAGVFGSWQLRRRRMIASIRRGKSVVSEREAEALVRAKKRLNTTRSIRIVVLDEAFEPGVWGVFSPTIVVPAGFCEHLEPGELDAFLFHEIIHVKRWDNLIGNLNMLLCCAFWFHPLVWLLDRKLLSERERVCDESVIAMDIDSEVYASSILKVCRICSGQELPGLSCAAGSNLRRRIEEIMSNTSRKHSPFHRLLIIGAVISLAVMSVSAAMLGRLDQGPQNLNPREPAAQLLANVSDPVMVQNVINFVKSLPDVPETPIEFKNTDGAPLSIVSATIKAAKIGQRSGKDKAGVGSENAVDIFCVKVMTSLINNTAKGVNAIVVELVNEDSARRGGLDVYNVTIKPYASTSDASFLADVVGDPSRLSLKVVGVRFDDSSTWGAKLFSPPPPPPPGPRSAPRGPSSPPSGPPSPPPTPGMVDGPKVIRKAGGVLQGEAIKKVEPSYPEMAMAAQISGSVVVEVRIDEQGKVESVRSISGHPLLRDAAVTAASQWEFKPTKLEGQPVKVVGTITFNFQM